MLVFDTSAYINGQKDHFLLTVVPSVWTLIEQAIDDRRIILPREVYRELTQIDDDLSTWIKRHSGVVAEPSEGVQRRAGESLPHFPTTAGRNRADPFILAEAETRGFVVVTYEGRSFSGRPTKNWASSMPGICQHFEIGCRTLPEALEMLGVSV